MSKGQLSENDHIRVPVNARRTAWRVSRGILGSALLVFSALAPAENAGGNRPDSVVIPWSLLSSPPYLPDPGFWGGLYKPDGFTPSYVDDSFFGRKVVRLGNGDVIVAGVARFLQYVTGSTRDQSGAGALQRDGGQGRMDQSRRLRLQRLRDLSQHD